MEKKLFPLWRYLPYIFVTCAVLFIGVLIHFRDKTPVPRPVVKMDTSTSVKNTASTSKKSNQRASEHRASETHHLNENELSSSGGSPTEVSSEGIHSETEVSPEAVLDTLVSSQIHTSQVRTADTGQTEDDYSIEVLHQEVHGFIKSLTDEINEKYPDVLELVSLSPEEILEKYPTKAALHALEERILQYESEFLEDIRSTVRALIWTGHTDELVDGLFQIRTTLREKWDDKTVEKIMVDIETQLDLK